MHVGVPKEIKTLEFCVGLVPGSVRELTHRGHRVMVETSAGEGIGFGDDAYRAAGAEIASSAEDILDAADMIVKVKEPQASEIAMLRDGQVLFTYLHLTAGIPAILLVFYLMRRVNVDEMKDAEAR